MNEKEIATQDAFNNLDKKLCSQLKKQMKTLEGSMLSIAEKCYTLREQDETQFYMFAERELNLSKPTISKFCIAGKISIECGGLVELPNSYSAVYELNKVSYDIETFNQYYIDMNEEELKDGSQRKIAKTVKMYLSDDSINETENETEDKIEKQETEEKEVDGIRENIENLKRLINSDIETIDKKFNKETFEDLKSAISLLFEMI